MGTSTSISDISSSDMGFSVTKVNPDDKVIALAGNPNVGKSSVFNQLTGLKQHTGNWPGKTVTNAQGICSYNGQNYIMVDLPGTYSLMAHSQEEETARDFLCFGNPDAAVIVCDATCIERNLNLVLQTLEITSKAVVCVNLMDEAKKHGVNVDLEKLSSRLGVPVVGTVARKGEGLEKLMDSIHDVLTEDRQPFIIRYIKPVEAALEIITPVLSDKFAGRNISLRWAALRLLEGEETLVKSMSQYLGTDINSDADIQTVISEAWRLLAENGIEKERLCDIIVSCIVLTAEDICVGSVSCSDSEYRVLDRRADKLLTSRLTGIPVMVLLLCIVFWITLSGANIPSEMLSTAFTSLEKILLNACIRAGFPEIIYKPVIFGIYHVLTWVIAVMLPPMAIFFPLFTILEDLGYLPRVAFNLDKCFKKCSACGKQALTMCLGFGCNAAGIVGCRIIDSPRERLIAILTNCFVPCNGKFPSLISIITMFFVISGAGILRSLSSAFILTAVVLLGVFMTFAASKILSQTVLKGHPSSFTLELPPYRRPDFGNILVRSVLDRTLFILGRAVSVAAPAGLVIWLFANVYIGDLTLLQHCSGFLDPFARVIGLDGTILFAFILGSPANEIVVPLIIMSYMSGGTITEASGLWQLKQLLVQNGWTWVTAVNMMLFSLMHWPCTTTLLTIKKETGSIKWTFLSLVIPTLFGIMSCFLFTSIVRLFQAVLP
ncbi:MAG: ferrous iron transport protein B [Clostridiales bacterium]|nr:ferrous iron transport protein B [Clostridiales bacterium]